MGDTRTTGRKPKPPKRIGREMRKDMSAESGGSRSRLEKVLRTEESNHSAAGSKTSGGTTRER